MPRSRVAGVVLLVLLVVLVEALAACGGTQPQEVQSVTVSPSITVTSNAFQDGKPMPVDYTCNGAGRIPPLAWSGTPSDAAALALVVDDPDAPSGTFTHWVVLDLPSGTIKLDGDVLPTGAVQAKNSGGRVGWYPPCPPSGIHRYRFTVYALSKATGLPNGVGLDQALGAVGDNAVAQGRLVGTYGR
ncbi:YbhB/YbcL family Raf kinase inhibitor-like protein [Monashia sp. NPDC004114]